MLTEEFFKQILNNQVLNKFDWKNRENKSELFNNIADGTFHDIEVSIYDYVIGNKIFLVCKFRQPGNNEIGSYQADTIEEAIDKFNDHILSRIKSMNMSLNLLNSLSEIFKNDR